MATKVKSVDDVVISDDMLQKWDTMMQGLTAEIEAKHQAERSLPEVLGEYVAIPGKPRWYRRGLKLRQEIRVQQIKAAMAEGSAASNHIEFAALLLWKLKLPQDPEEARNLVRHAIFEDDMSLLLFPVTEDNVLDNFSEQELVDLVLRPLGYRAEETAQSPNASGPPTAE
jgi:hypothetical protein